MSLDNIEAKIAEAPLSWTLEDKIHQLIMIDFTDPEIATERPWGGVILFDKNIESVQQVYDLNYKIIKESPFPPFISIDQEGGTVFRIDFPSYPAPPSQMAVGRIRDMYAAKIVSNINGRLLRALGFNVVFAPVLDVNTNPYNPIINVRAFGENPIQVALYGKYSIGGYREAGIIPVGKHFPGHGATSTDSHYTLPVVDKSKEKLYKEDIYPFKEAIEKANLSGIMTAHVLYPALDKEYPATLSKKIITKILREELGYDKVVFTDALSMLALKEYDFEEVLIEAINAGCDQLLVLSDDDSLKLEAVEIIYRAVKKGFIAEETINSAVGRILDLKRKFLLRIPDIDFEDETLQESIEFLRYIVQYSLRVDVLSPSELNTFQPDEILVLITEGQEKLKIHEPFLNWILKQGLEASLTILKVPGWGAKGDNPFTSQLLRKIAKRKVILATYLKHRLEGELLEGFRRMIYEMGPYILLNFANSYLEGDLPEEPVAKLFSFGYNHISQEELLKKLEELLKLKGS